VRRILARIQVIVAKSNESGARARDDRGVHVLLAAGRRPNVGELDLDLAGIRHGPDGVVVNKHLRTSNRRVYAIGDVTGGPRFATLPVTTPASSFATRCFRHPITVNIKPSRA